MKNKRKLFIRITALLLVSALTLLCGCDSLENGKPDENNGTIKHTSQTNDLGEPVAITGELLPIGDNSPELSAYPVTVNDTVIEKAPEKVICLSSGLTEMIYELGHGDTLIGRGSYCEYPEQAVSLKDFGKPAAPDIEAVKAAAPDILITATSIANMDVIALNDSGIDVVYIPAPHSLEEYGRIYTALGMIFEGLFDGESKGSAVFSGIESSLSSAGYSFGKFIYVTEGLTVAGGDTFESSVLSLYGTNLAKDASGYGFDKSQLVSEQPDTVILNSGISSEELASDAVLGALDAVKSGKVYTVSNSYFESPSGRLVGILDEISGGTRQ